MSSPDAAGRRPALHRRRAAALALALAGPALLGGCLRPLYGGEEGAGLTVTLRDVAVDPIPDRVGHFLRQELTFELDHELRPSAADLLKHPWIANTPGPFGQ